MAETRQGDGACITVTDRFIAVIFINAPNFDFESNWFFPVTFFCRRGLVYLYIGLTNRSTAGHIDDIVFFAGGALTAEKDGDVLTLGT